MSDEEGRASVVIATLPDDKELTELFNRWIDRYAPDTFTATGRIRRVRLLAALLGDVPNETWEIVEAMQQRGFWCQIRTPFMADEGLYWAGFTPQGTSGWNGTPDNWTGAPRLSIAVCVAALAALDQQEQYNEEQYNAGN